MTQFYHELLGANGSGLKSGASLRVIYPDLANQILKDCAWDKQRNPKESVIRQYSIQMDRGEWKPGSMIRLAWVPNHPKPYLMDGQHRLLAQVRANKPVRYLVSLEEVSSEEEAALIYATIDRGSSRTPFDQLHAFGVDDLHGWTQTQTNQALSAIKFLANDFIATIPYFTVQVQMDLVEKYGEVCSEWFDDISCLSTPELKRTSCRRDILSVGIATLFYARAQYGVDSVRDFWAGTLSGEMLARGDARLVAHRYLNATVITGGGAVKGKIVSPNESSRTIANCFNAWVEDRELTFTRVYKEGAPISILGTPWNGKNIQVERILWDNI